MSQLCHKIITTFVIVLQICRSDARFLLHNSLNSDGSGICGQNEELVDCVDPCPATCQLPNPPQCVNFRCQEGCQCQPGFIRHEPNGLCVPIEECRNYCGANQVFRDCGPACPDTCGLRNRPCDLNCVSGCFCKRGFILESAFGNCISLDSCID